MSLVMQILVGGVVKYDSAGRKMVAEGGQWQTLHVAIPPTADPYRYDRRDDAEAMLDRMYPDMPRERKRVVDELKSKT